MELLLSYIDIVVFFVNNNYIISFLLFLFFLIIFLSLSLPGNLIFFLLSGFLFGLYFGFIINILSNVLGSFIFFLFSKYFFNKFFSKFYSKYSNKVNSIIKNSSYEYLIILRLIPGPPLMAQNICLSLLNISKTKFILTTFIGFIPLMFLTAFIGSEFSNILDLKNFNLNDIFSFKFLIILFVLILIIIFRILIKKRPSN